MRKILILGGTGAMGTFLVDILRGYNDYEVYVTSRCEHYCTGNVKYIVGNARDAKFMDKVLSEVHYDVIVDFMNYGYQEFLDCYCRLLNATDHYVFLSSSRVYDYSETPIVETSSRLLDVTKDKEFLATQRYALRKARQENILENSGHRNYTIIRPYITYSKARLQLGIYEKEQWLFRMLHDKSVVLTEGILEKVTSLTFGYDVSYGIFRIIEHGNPEGDKVHIVTKETMTWADVLRIYADVILRETGKKIKVYTSKDINIIENLFEGGYNTKYDRLFDRRFDNRKAAVMCGNIQYMQMINGLSSCVKEFIDNWKVVGDSAFLRIMWDYEAYMDRITGEKTPVNEIPSESEKKEYLEIINDSRYSYLENCNLNKVILWI